MTKNKMINVRIEPKLYNDYKKHCNKNGFSISKRIRILLENDIKKNDN